MPGVGLGIVFVGYSFLYYGVSQIRGGNWGYLDLVVPGRWAKAQNTPTDHQAAPKSKSSSTSSVAGSFLQGASLVNPAAGIASGLGNLVP